MNILKRLLCILNFMHEVEERWMLLSEAKLSMLEAVLYGCTIRDGCCNYFKCRVCGAVIAPFEQSRRSYKVVSEQ
jgi:hypothetical protein